MLENKLATNKTDNGQKKIEIASPDAGETVIIFGFSLTPDFLTGEICSFHFTGKLGVSLIPYKLMVSTISGYLVILISLYIFKLNSLKYSKRFFYFFLYMISMLS
jgi:hypothetical protein